MYGLSLSIGPLCKTNKYSTGLPIPPYGLKVLIHNHTFPSTFFETFISITPGEETNLIVDKMASSNSPRPYSYCTDLTNGFNSDVFNWMMANKKAYRQKDCYDLCLSQYFNIQTVRFDKKFKMQKI